VLISWQLLLASIKVMCNIHLEEDAKPIKEVFIWKDG